MEKFMFDSTEFALLWSTEVLRKRRFPKVSGFYREIISDENQRGGRNDLPQDMDDRLDLALKVWSVVGDILIPKEQLFIQYRYLGDYTNEQRLRRALQLQEKLRGEGKRVRLSYVYSYRDLGVIFKIDHKTAKRRLDKYLSIIQKELEKRGLLIKMSPLAS